MAPQTDEIKHIVEQLRRLEEKIDKLVSKEVLELVMSGYELRISKLEEWRAGMWKQTLSIAGAVVALLLGVLTLLNYIKLP